MIKLTTESMTMMAPTENTTTAPATSSKRMTTYHNTTAISLREQYQLSRSSSSSFQNPSKAHRKGLVYLLLVYSVCAISSYCTSAYEVRSWLWPSTVPSATTARNMTAAMPQSLTQEDVYNSIKYYNINNGNDNDNKEDNQKQIAIIHVGPHKTGSTALQSSVFRTLKYEQILQEQDNFALFPFDQRSGSCFFPATPPKDQKQKKQCWVDNSDLQLMKDAVQNATTNHQHLMYSAEILELTDRFNLTTLRDHFLPRGAFEMRISVVYRRFYEWIISSHGHRYRKVLEDWDDWPSDTYTKQHRVSPIAYALSEELIQDRIQNRYTVRTYKTYQEYFPNTTYLINYHDNVVLKNDVIMTALANEVAKASAAAAARTVNHTTSNHGNTSMGNDYGFSKELSSSWVESLIHNDFVTNFACHPKSNTPHFCAIKQQETYEKALLAIQSALLPTSSSLRHGENRLEEEPLKSNVGETTFYDEILMAAYSKGILPENVTHIMRRFRARNIVQYYMEKNDLFQINQGSRSTLPLVCINDKLADLLLEISLNVERELLPNFFASPQGEKAMRKDFESFRNSTKVCSVDTEKVFEQHPAFHTFFSYENFIKFV